MHDASLSIGEVAERTGVAPSALRFYEREGLLHAGRNAGGQRRFPREVLRRVAFVRVAQRVGLTLDEIRAALATLPDQRTPTAADWARVSRSWRPRLDAQIAMLERLRDDLSSCIGCGCLSLGTCALYNRGDRAAALGPGPRYLLGDTPDDARFLSHAAPDTIDARRAGARSVVRRRPAAGHSSSRASTANAASADRPST